MERCKRADFFGRVISGVIQRDNLVGEHQIAGRREYICAAQVGAEGVNHADRVPGTGCQTSENGNEEKEQVLFHLKK